MNASVVPLRRPKKASTSSDIDLLLENAREASDFLKALSHEARLVILCLLSEGEKSVTEIERILDLRQPAVSQQLGATARRQSRRYAPRRKEHLLLAVAPRGAAGHRRAA